MIFPNLLLEEIVQVDDKTRLDGTQAFVSKGDNPVTLVRIKPEAAASFVNVTGTAPKDWYLDWEYATAGAKTATMEITTDTTPTSSPVTVTKDFTLTVVTAAVDKLFSGDADLQIHEPGLLKYVPAGKNSFLFVHRRAQTLIIKHIDEAGWVDSAGNKITKDAFVDLDEVRSWSAFVTLRLIFEGLSNTPDDNFDKKAKIYKSMELEARNKTALRLDVTGDGTISKGEYLTMTSVRAYRR